MWLDTNFFYVFKNGTEANDYYGCHTDVGGKFMDIVVGLKNQVDLAVSSTSGTEATATAITVTATATYPVSGAQTVDLNVTGTGITSGDYTLSSTSIILPDGATSGSVTFTIEDDAYAEGEETATLEIVNPSDGLELGTATSQEVTITDNDAAGFSFTESGGTTQVDESGTTDSFDVVLTARPQSDVVIDVISGDTGEATVNETSLTFNPDTWDHPQTVTVMGVADGTLDGNQTVPITLSVDDAHSDDAFDPLADQTVDVTVTDSDVQSYTGPTATGTGDATLTINGGTCALDLDNTAFIATDGLNIPAGAQFTQGAVTFRVTGCSPGRTIEVTLTYPEVLDNALAWKLDEVEDGIVIADAVIEGDTLRYSITDGGLLDQDGAEDGNFSDPAAVGILASAIPTLGEWGRWLLLASMLLFGWGVFRVRRRF